MSQPEMVIHLRVTDAAELVVLLAQGEDSYLTTCDGVEVRFTAQPCEDGRMQEGSAEEIDPDDLVDREVKDWEDVK